MPRLLFTKTGDAVWMSHLDLMRLFQRAFKRAGLLLTHTQGYNPRPSVSIAMPLSVGVESQCELLDFELEGEFVAYSDVVKRLNQVLVDGIEVLDCYGKCKKLKELAYLDCVLTMEYDNGIASEQIQKLETLFSRGTLVVEKKGKNGLSDQDIIPMIRKIQIQQCDAHKLQIIARVCCQNPSLNPTQLIAAIAKYEPDCSPDHAVCRRVELLDVNETRFR